MSEDRADGARVAESLADYLADELAVLPDISDIGQAAEQIAALFAANGGATFNLYFGNMLGQPYYAVSLYLRSRGQAFCILVRQEFESR